VTSSDLYENLQEGLRLCGSGAFAEAEQLYRALTQNHPEAPDAWNMLAVVLQQRGAFDEASHASVRATELRPAIAPYWLVRGNIAAEEGRLDDAEASYRRATALEPAFAEARFRLACVLHQRLRLEEAVSAYSEALRLAPDIAEIHWRLAEALAAMDRPELAIASYERAFRLDPDRTFDRRGALDCLRRFEFQTLPQFWTIELGAYFARQDIDKGEYVPLALTALKKHPAFGTALSVADGAFTIDSAVRTVLSNPLLHAILRDSLLIDAAFERLLVRLRAHLLFHEDAREKLVPEFFEAFALQCFSNEFVFAETAAETERVSKLLSDMELRLASNTPFDERAVPALLTLALYRPLGTVAGIDELASAAHVPAHLATLLERSVTNTRAERALRDTIASIVPIERGTSEAVRGMYEENPYPRWFTIDREPPFALSEWLRRELPWIPTFPIGTEPRILVAGCGTGRDALWLASNIAGSKVLGVDLSLSSLAYARRMADRLHVRNVEFRHGDILRLPELAERFDCIASTGVLHHMREPLAGLRAIAKLLRPGGLMKLGFYSRRARVSVTAAREAISASRIGASATDIRQFRQRVFDAPADSPLKELEIAPDFYSTSMCRDLLFHVQEHQYGLPEIADMLGACGLEFLGLSDLPAETLGRYASMFPDDPRRTNIAYWDRYEERYPRTFSRMFLLWCRAPR
jgi:SAM-dependent methyltransferase/Tfp pilus assembly protein PilF